MCFYIVGVDISLFSQIIWQIFFFPTRPTMDLFISSIIFCFLLPLAFILTSLHLYLLLLTSFGYFFIVIFGLCVTSSFRGNEPKLANLSSTTLASQTAHAGCSVSAWILLTRLSSKGPGQSLEVSLTAKPSDITARAGRQVCVPITVGQVRSWCRENSPEWLKWRAVGWPPLSPRHPLLAVPRAQPCLGLPSLRFSSFLTRTAQHHHGKIQRGTSPHLWDNFPAPWFLLPVGFSLIPVLSSFPSSHTTDFEAQGCWGSVQYSVQAVTPTPLGTILRGASLFPAFQDCPLSPPSRGAREGRGHRSCVLL